MQKHPERVELLSELGKARYALLRTYRRDGTAVDTPIWFDVQTSSVVFRTKIGPKTNRLAARPEVELTPCDYRGQIRSDAKTFAGQATILSGTEAQEANGALRRRYGWQCNFSPLTTLPPLTNLPANH